MILLIHVVTLGVNVLKRPCLFFCSLFYWQYIPLMVLSILILILIQDSGNFFRRLPKLQMITFFKEYLIKRPYLFFCSVFYWQSIPLMVLSILILILIEASGNGHNYQNLPEGKSAQLNLKIFSIGCVTSVV